MCEEWDSDPLDDELEGLEDLGDLGPDWDEDWDDAYGEDEDDD